MYISIVFHTENFHILWQNLTTLNFIKMYVIIIGKSYFENFVFFVK